MYKNIIHDERDNYNFQDDFGGFDSQDCIPEQPAWFNQAPTFDDAPPPIESESYDDVSYDEFYSLPASPIAPMTPIAPIAAPKTQSQLMIDEIIKGRFSTVTRDELVSMAIEHNGLLWNSSTGTGKTYTVVNSDGKDILAVPSISIAKQVKAQYPHVELLYGEVSVDELSECDKYVVVYDSFYRLFNWLGESVTDYVAWIDEAHITAHSFRSRASYLMMGLAKQCKTFIGMTATDLGDTMFHFSAVNRAKYTKVRGDIPTVVTNESTTAILKAIDGTVVMHMNNKAIAEKMKAKHGGELFNSDEKGTATYDSIVNKGVIPCRILWVTSLFDVGLSISHTGKVTVVITEESAKNCDPHMTEQIVNRFRDADKHYQIDRLIIQMAKPKALKEGEKPKPVDVRHFSDVIKAQKAKADEIVTMSQIIIDGLNQAAIDAKARGLSNESVTKHTDQFLKGCGVRRNKSGTLEIDTQHHIAVNYESMVTRMTTKQRVEWLCSLYPFRFDGFLDLGDDDESRLADKEVKKVARVEGNETRKETYVRVVETAQDGRQAVEAIIEDKTGQYTKHEKDCASGLLKASNVGHGVNWSDVVKLAIENGCDSKAKMEKMSLALLVNGIEERAAQGEGTTNLVVKNLNWFRNEVTNYIEDYGKEAYLDGEYVAHLAKVCKENDRFVAIGHGVGKAGTKAVRKLIKAMFKVGRTSVTGDDGKQVQVKVILNESPIGMDVRHFKKR